MDLSERKWGEVSDRSETKGDPYIALAELMKRDDLPSMLADVLIAIALKREDEPTPHEVARQASKAFGWSEQTWREVVRSHVLARLSSGEI